MLKVAAGTFHVADVEKPEQDASRRRRGLGELGTNFDEGAIAQQLKGLAKLSTT